MKKEYILFIDSGLGGLSTLANCLNQINGNFLYFADNKNCPYGKHSKEEIIKFLNEIILKLTPKYNISCIVIACNTATAAAIDELRKKYNNICFVGTEPAIMLAAKQGYKNIFSLTTPLTNRLERYQNLIFKSKSNIMTISPKNLVKNIEEFYQNNTYQSRFALLKEASLVANMAKSCDCIILGCTHFVFFRPFLQKFTKLPLLDGNNGIAKKLISLSPSFQKKHQKNYVKIMLSCKNNALLKKYKKILSQTLAKFEHL